MPDILVRNVPKETLDALKALAARHRRSLQQELLGILEASARESRISDPARLAATIQARLASSGRVFGDSTELIREDRER